MDDSENLFLVEFGNGFMISAKNDGFVAHVHWQGQKPVDSWNDVQRLTEESGALPCFMPEDYAEFTRRHGEPPVEVYSAVFDPVLNAMDGD